MNRLNHPWTRRDFLNAFSCAGAGALLESSAALFAAEPSPETKRIRVPQIPSTCRSPEWMAEELLRTEGFTDVQYLPVQGTQGVERALARGTDWRIWQQLKKELKT